MKQAYLCLFQTLVKVYIDVSNNFPIFQIDLLKYLRLTQFLIGLKTLVDLEKNTFY